MRRPVIKSLPQAAVGVVRRYAQRAGQISRLILACFVLGLSTRKVSEALFTILGEKVIAATVSRVARVLDRVVESFHRTPRIKGA